jgi:tripartite-type tricarboxylate transporter receptor subunit TctC
MQVHRRQFLRHGFAVTALTISECAFALDYPTRPVRWIVGYPPGSPADAVMRIMAQWLSERLGKPVIVENRPGAATNIAAQAAIASPPDGYTLVHIASSTAVNATLYKSLSFNFLRDSAPVAGIVNFSHVMLVNPSVPASTVTEFIAYAKANPGKISLASYGTGTVSHLAGELFKTMTGTDMIHVPYRGDGTEITDLIGGRVQALITVLTGTLPHIQSGALRALARCDFRCAVRSVTSGSHRERVRARIRGTCGCRCGRPQKVRHPRSSRSSTVRLMLGWRIRSSRRISRT